MVAAANCAALLGIEAIGVRVEAQIFGNLRRFSIVGLPDGVVKESKDRIRCAIENSGFSFPTREVIVSLSPASVPKAGAAFDLPIALSILCAEGQLETKVLERILILGELGLDGSLKPIPGAFAVSNYAQSENFREIVLPSQTASLAALAGNVPVRAVTSLEQAIHYLRGEVELAEPDTVMTSRLANKEELLLDDVIGQHSAKRALEICAAGGHNLLMVGPPGSGKTMLAKRLPYLLPELATAEAIEVTQIHELAKRDISSEVALKTTRPFRFPHHSTSLVGLIGGGSIPTPGEISLAHRGVLFLDEFPEYPRSVLESLREPLENKKITISRANGKLEFPADFILVAAMNPCPCGKRYTLPRACKCDAGMITRYLNKLSGPLLDRIDLHVWTPQLPLAKLSEVTASKEKPAVEHHTALKRIQAARAVQAKRFDTGLRLNAHLRSNEARMHCLLDQQSQEVLLAAAERFSLSARSYTRVLKVARTIADLAHSRQIQITHLEEALSYRLPNHFEG